MNVEVKTEHALSRKLNDMSAEELSDMMSDVADKAADEVSENDSTLGMSSIGAKYRVGPIDVTAAIGNVVLLYEINSPFITGEIGEVGDDLDTMDCLKAIYVLAKGREAVRPIMAMKQRIQALANLKTMVEGNPELMDKLMDRAEKIGEAETEFSDAARRFYEENFVGYDFQEVVESVLMGIADVVKASDELPAGDDSKKKLDWTMSGL